MDTNKAKMVIAILVALALWSKFGHASDRFQVAELDEVSVEYKEFQGQPRNSLLYPITPTSSLNLKINIDVLKYGFFRNEILTNSTATQFKSVGWHYQVGFTIFRSVDVYFDHQSLHILDGTIQSMPNFPVENSLAVRVYLYRR